MSRESPIEEPPTPAPPASEITRRSLLQRAAVLGLAGTTLGALDLLAPAPLRAAAAGLGQLPEIQFAIGHYTPPPVKVEGVRIRAAPVYTTFATIALTRNPTAADQATLQAALATIESAYRSARPGCSRPSPMGSRTSNGFRAG